MNRISRRQLRNVLGIPSQHELDAFLKHHNPPLEYTIEDFERERDERPALAEVTRRTRIETGT